MIKNKRLVYIEEYEELFVDIQTQQILADQKSFVDSEPIHAVREILEAYRTERTKVNFDLKDFYLSHFALNSVETSQQIAVKTIDEHINHLWDLLTKYPGSENGTLIPLPEKFVVPGGRFREIFYWDSYFTMLGLQVSRRVDLIESMVRNFAYLIDEFGFIPNGNRTYFLTRSQPPFFSLMVQLLSEEIGEQALLTYLPQLEREYDFWMSGYERLNEEVNREKRVVRMPGGEILNRYWDASDTPRPEGYIHDLETFEKAGKRDREIFRHIRAAAESGWDFSVRWFGDEKNVATICTCDLVPVDLNCLLLHLERTLERGFRLKGDLHGTESYAARAVRREGAIRKYLWDIEEKTFSDHNFLSKRPSPVANTGMVYPLFFKIATDMEAMSIKNQLETKFLQPGGLLPTLRYSGEQWDAPNGWAPLQWMAYCALKNYGHDDCASNIAQRWTKNVEYVFNKNGRLTEKYNVVNDKLIAGGGEYANQDGFGWTNGVYLAFKKWEQSF